jgi:hypothetical protein
MIMSRRVRAVRHCRLLITPSEARTTSEADGDGDDDDSVQKNLVN